MVPCAKCPFSQNNYKGCVFVSESECRFEPTRHTAVCAFQLEQGGSPCDCGFRQPYQPAGLETDHINHHGIDNQRCNLRNVTKAQNGYNQKLRGGSSRYKGVCWDKANQKWMAYIRIEGRQTKLGRFRNELVAARAYDTAARKYHGVYALCNFEGELCPVG